MSLFKLSIIIPFYNTIEYIDDCINSIKDNISTSDLNKIQILLINDGSNFKTTKKINIKKYKNTNIELYNKKNGNWGSVINYVKNNKLAKGQYITILDSDDKYTVNYFKYLCEYLNNFQPDILVSDFAEWKSDKNKIKRKKVILSNKSKFYTINKKNIHKFKTPYSFPLGKFYKNEIFYKLADLKENVYFQDVKLYYLCLNCSITYGYINKVIGLHRSDRDDSSTNIAWSKAKVDMWIDTIKTLSTHDVLLNGIFYLTVKGFKKAYLKYYSSRFNVNGKILMCYLPKVLYPLVICFVWFLLIKFRKIIKVSNKK